jgi:excisionase family DNA binding protein
MCPSVSKADAVRSLVENANPSELPALAAELARALADVLVRTASVAPITAVAARDQSDSLLTVKEAAERLSVAPSWLYRHAKRLPFTRKLGHRTLRFEAVGLERWTASRVAGR